MYSEYTESSFLRTPAVVSSVPESIDKSLYEGSEVFLIAKTCFAKKSAKSFGSVGKLFCLKGNDVNCAIRRVSLCKAASLKATQKESQLLYFKSCKTNESKIEGI